MTGSRPFNTYRFAGRQRFIVIERLRALTLAAGVPIIIISADKTCESEMQALASAVTAYLHKSFAQEALLAAVRSTLLVLPS